MGKKRAYLYIGICLTLALALSGALFGLSAEAAPTEITIEEAEDNANKLDGLRQQQKDIEIEIERLRDEQAKQEGIIDSALLTISGLEAEMSLIQQQIVLYQEAIDEAEIQIARAERQIADAEVRLAERQELLQQRLVSLYMHGEITLLDVVFETDSFEDFLVVYDMTERIMAQDAELLDQVTAERDFIIATKEKLEKTRDEWVKLQRDQEDKRTDLKRKQNEYYGVIAAAEMSVAELEAAEEAFEARQASIGDDIRSLLASSNSLLTFGGSLGWPLPAGWTYVNSPFGWRIHPIYGTQRFHAGIDIPADGGTPIYAAGDGQILFVGWQDGYGNTVMVEHGDGIVTLYAHQSAFGEFGKGDIVVRGDTVGYVGTTGASTGNHLHFEVRANGDPVDPQPYLNY